MSEICPYCGKGFHRVASHAWRCPQKESLLGAPGIETKLKEKCPDCGRMYVNLSQHVVCRFRKVNKYSEKKVLHQVCNVCKGTVLDLAHHVKCSGNSVRFPVEQHNEYKMNVQKIPNTERTRHNKVETDYKAKPTRSDETSQRYKHHRTEQTTSQSDQTSVKPRYRKEDKYHRTEQAPLLFDQTSGKSRSRKEDKYDRTEQIPTQSDQTSVKPRFRREDKYNKTEQRLTQKTTRCAKERSGLKIEETPLPFGLNTPPPSPDSFHEDVMDRWYLQSHGKLPHKDYNSYLQCGNADYYRHSNTSIGNAYRYGSQLSGNEVSLDLNIHNSYKYRLDRLETVRDRPSLETPPTSPGETLEAQTGAARQMSNNYEQLNTFLGEEIIKDLSGEGEDIGNKEDNNDGEEINKNLSGEGEESGNKEENSDGEEINEDLSGEGEDIGNEEQNSDREEINDDVSDEGKEIGNKEDNSDEEENSDGEDISNEGVENGNKEKDSDSEETNKDVSGEGVEIGNKEENSDGEEINEDMSGVGEEYGNKEKDSDGEEVNEDMSGEGEKIGNEVENSSGKVINEEACDKGEVLRNEKENVDGGETGAEDDTCVDYEGTGR